MEAGNCYAGGSLDIKEVPCAVLIYVSEEADARQKLVQGQHENTNACLTLFKVYCYDPT